MVLLLFFFNFLDSIIRNDFLINDDQIGGAVQERPKGASYSQRIGITFGDFRDGNSSPFFKIFSLNGQILKAEERVSDDWGLRWKGEPAITFYQNRIVIAWEDRRGCNSDIYYQIFDSLGNEILDNRKANDDHTQTDQRGTAIAFLPDGRFIIVWEDWRNDYGDIYAQIFDFNGNPVGNNFRVNDDPIGYAWQYHPSVGVKSDGEFIIVWQDGRNGNWDIYCQIFDANGNRQGSNFRINDDNSSSWQFSPNIKVNKNNYWLVCWEDERNGNWDIYAQIFNSANQRIRENFIVNDDNTQSSQHSPFCESDTNGNFIIVFICEREGKPDIYKQIFSSEGIRIGNNEKVNDDINNSYQGFPSIISLINNHYLIIWEDEREGNLDIYGQFYDENNRKVGSNFKINEDFASSQQRCPFITANNQYFGVCWEDEREGNCHIYATFFDTLGNFLIENKKVSDEGYNFSPSITLNNLNKALIIFISLRNNDIDIYGQILDINGNLIGRNFKINDDTNNAFQDFPNVATSPDNRFLVIWSDSREGRYLIYGQYYDSLLNPIGNNFRISDNTTGNALFSFLTFNETLPIFVWMDNRLGDYNVYLKIGNQPSILVNEETNGFQGYPTCATKDSLIVVSWEDERNGNVDIYCQLFKINGEKIGDNILVNDDNTNADQYSPSIVFIPDNEFIIIFSDFRKGRGDVDVYAQRFDYFGNKISNNRVVHEPDIFWGNNQWTFSQSIAQINGIIGFSWIDNKRHKGWDIYGKLVKKNYLLLSEKNKKNFDIQKKKKIFSILGEFKRKKQNNGIYFVGRKKEIYLKGAKNGFLFNHHDN